MFKTKLKDAKIKFGSRSILMQALCTFRELFSPVKAKVIKDKYGKIGFKIPGGYLLGKRETYGDIVSVHKRIWDKAKRNNEVIILYLQNSGYFYRFDPNEIRETAMNERGGAKMINFDIREGINLMKLRAFKKKVNQMVDKNLNKEERELKRLSETCL